MRRSASVTVLALTLLLAGCSGASTSEQAERSPSSSGLEPTGSASPPADSTASPGPSSVVGPECRARDGRAVRQLPDVTVPEVVLPAVTSEDGEVLAEPLTVGPQLVDAGCVIRFDAPGGCLGAVRITAAEIPAATIPETVVGDRVYPAVTASAESRPAVEAPQVCQVERDGKLGTVTREGIVREGFSRHGVARPGDELVPTVRLEPVRLPDVDVDPERLTSRRLPERRDVDVLAGRRGTAYVAPARVLFDSDQARIRPEAARALRAIARKIRNSASGRTIRVEGHTDDRGDEEYGLRLSRQRAEAVKQWLVRDAGFEAAAISTRGYGETAPAVPNTSDANRQLNRRVVIVVPR